MWLLNSTSTMFALLQKLPTSSELIAGISGTKKVEEVTEQAESSRFFGDQRTGMKSIKIVDEFIIHPNTVISLEVGECVVIEEYPRATSQIVSVRREVTDDYLPNSGVRELLDGMRRPEPPQPPPPSRIERIRDLSPAKPERKIEI